MSELPDIDMYLDAMQSRVVGQPLTGVRLASPQLLKSAYPPLEVVIDRYVIELRRLGKKIAIEVEGNLWLVLRLANAGRLQWERPQTKVPGRTGQAAFDFPNGTLMLTEFGPSRRTALWLLRGADLKQHQPGGVEPLSCSLDDFGRAIRGKHHTLKRSLTLPSCVSGIGTVYADEILYRAGLSPVMWTQDLTDRQLSALHRAMSAVLWEWKARLTEQAAGNWPAKVPEVRREMAVHGRCGKPCQVCRVPVQRLSFGTSTADYCPGCQTGGVVISVEEHFPLLQNDWPRRHEDWE